jgi:hypothetical protein
MARFHKGNDGWGRDSYRIPQYAVAGCSVTDEEGPAPASLAKRELIELRDYLRDYYKIRCRFKATPSGNCCMHKAWLVVAGKDFVAAQPQAEQWLADHWGGTHLIHDAK